MACPSALISSGPCLQMEALGKLASARTVCGAWNNIVESMIHTRE